MSELVEQPAGLISVLLDKSAAFGDRDDAAMDLGSFENPEAVNALLKIVQDLTEDEDLIDSAAESLMEIWSKSGQKNPDLIKRMHPIARRYFN